MPLPVSDEPGEARPDEAVTKLNEGLKVCHKVVTNYRAALSLRPHAGGDQDTTPQRKN